MARVALAAQQSQLTGGAKNIRPASWTAFLGEIVWLPLELTGAAKDPNDFGAAATLVDFESRPKRSDFVRPIDLMLPIIDHTDAAIQASA